MPSERCVGSSTAKHDVVTNYNTQHFNLIWQMSWNAINVQLIHWLIRLQKCCLCLKFPRCSRHRDTKHFWHDSKTHLFTGHRANTH